MRILKEFGSHVFILRKDFPLRGLLNVAWQQDRLGTIRQPYDEGIIVLRCLTLGKVLRPQNVSGDIAPSERVALPYMHDMNAALMGNRENLLIGSAADIPAHTDCPNP